MKEFTLVINHSVAPSVTINAQTKVVLKGMKEPTQVKNHSAAPSVTINAPDQMF